MICFWDSYQDHWTSISPFVGFKLGKFQCLHGCNESHILTPIKESLDRPMWEKSHGRTKNPTVGTIEKSKLFMINESWGIFILVGLWPTNRFILLIEFSMLFH